MDPQMDCENEEKESKNKQKNLALMACEMEMK